MSVIYPSTVNHKGIKYHGGVKEDHIVYANIQLVNKILGIITLKPGWQDGNRVYTFQDIYWEDKYDCKIMQREAA